MGGVHAAWAGVVASGLAQTFLDFIFRLHFIDPPYHVSAFSLATAAMLIGVTAGIGLVCGLLVALVWNAIAPR